MYAYIRYLQLMTTIERSYLYQGKLERHLKEQGCPIDREGGDDYSIGWPLLFKAIDLLYKVFFIVLFELVLMVKAITGGVISLDVFTLIDWIALAIISLPAVLNCVYLRQGDRPMSAGRAAASF